MKKLLVLFFILSITAGLTAVAESNNYTYGTVKISQDNELPSGYFSKAKNYLPGDNISLSNPQTGAVVNVLNLGTLEDEDEVALLVAPEVAKKLGIDFSVQLRVKLSPRPDNFDEIASGNGVMSYGSSVYEEENNYINETPAKVEPVADLSAIDDFPEKETSAVAVSKDPEPIKEENLTEDNINPSNSKEEELSEEIAEVKTKDENPSVEETIVEKYVEPLKEENTVAQAEPVQEVVEDIVEDVFENTDTIKDSFVAEEETIVSGDKELEKIDALPIDDIVALEENEDDKIDEHPVAEEKETRVEAIAEKINDEPIKDLDPFDFNESIVTDAIADEPQVVIHSKEDKKEEIAEIEYEEYEIEEEEEVIVPEVEEIVETTSVFSLTPTGSVVPEYNPDYAVKQSKKPTKNTAKEEKKKETVKIEPKPVIEEKKPAKATVKEDKEVVVKDKNLRNGSYYIQIATATTKESGMKIVEKYNKYPIILVPFEKKEGYKVLVGPLNGDEYGAILEKFKAFGYKDAFIRKIK